MVENHKKNISYERRFTYITPCQTGKKKNPTCYLTPISSLDASAAVMGTSEIAMKASDKLLMPAINFKFRFLRLFVLSFDKTLSHRPTPYQMVAAHYHIIVPVGW